MRFFFSFQKHNDIQLFLMLLISYLFFVSEILIRMD